MSDQDFTTMSHDDFTTLQAAVGLLIRLAQGRVSPAECVPGSRHDGVIERAIEIVDRDA